MGKASRARSARQAVNELKKEQELALQAQKKKKRFYNLITAVVAVILSGAFLGSIIFLNVGENNGYFLRKKDAMKTDNFSVNGATFTYFFNYTFQEFINKNSNSLASHGLDVSVSPREQYMADGTSWFDYLVNQARTNLTEVLLLAEKSKADGLKLDEKDQKTIDDFFTNIKKDAEASKQEVSEYIQAVFGKGVNEQDIRNGLEISTLATKSFEKFINNLSFTQKEKDDFFEKNKNKFLAVDYKSYTFVPTLTADMTEKDKADAIAKSKANADRLMKATTPEEFDSILTKILMNNGKTKEQAASIVEGTVLKENLYDENFNISKWAFGDKATLYGTQLHISGNNSAVYMLTKLPYKNEGETRSVRHILLSSNSTNDAEMKKKAEDILAEYNKGEKTAEAFGALATKYTTDEGSKSTGGLYENFKEGEMVEPFEKWSFDSARKEGDTGIVKSDYGYHIMYFVAKGKPIWEANLDTVMKNEAYTNFKADLAKKYPIENNDDILSDIPVIKFINSTSNTSSTAGTTNTSSHDHDHDH